MNPIAERLVEACRMHARARALEDGEEAMSYAALLDAAQTVAATLGRARVRTGEPVPVAVSNRARDVAALLGVWLAGAVAVPVHRQSPSGVVDGLLERTGARLVVNARPDLPAPGALAGDAAPRGAPPPPRPLLESAALIVFTSGSTGEPKGVVVSADRLDRKLDMIGAETLVEPGVRMLLALQLTFSFGQWVTLLTLLRGGTLVMRARFDPAVTMADLVDARIARAPMVPTMLRAMLPLAEAGPGPAFAGIVMAGGETLPGPVGRRLLEAWPRARIGDIYGLSETGTSDFFVAPDEYAEAAGTIGRAGRGIEWRLAADGELQIRSPWRMAGYLDAPGPTRAAFADGYFRTGDLARVRDDGRVALVGRSKEIVVRAGNKVAPMEVENVFLEHPDVDAALATGLPDQRLGETLHLLVVPRHGAQPDPARLRDWAAERLERWKLPDRIHLGEALPTGRTGKADRGALARALRAAAAKAPGHPPGSGRSGALR